MRTLVRFATLIALAILPSILCGELLPVRTYTSADGLASDRVTCVGATVLVADPIPESPRGTDPTTEFVAVGSRSPAPRPIRRRPRTTLPYVVDAVELAEICHKPAAIAARAAATVNLTPMRRARNGDIVALDHDHGGDRQDAQTGLQGGIPEVELEELGLDEQRPHEPEDSEALRRQRDGEPSIAEEPEFEHRVVASGLPGKEGGRGPPHWPTRLRPRSPRSTPRWGPR